MQENVQLAKGLAPSGTAKISAEEAWDDIARKINVYGPPERTGSEWKKIWADLKCRTKKKVFENNKNANACGEGSCRMQYLSDLEQSVERILNFSSMTASQGFDDSSNDSAHKSEFDNLLSIDEVKIEPHDTATNIKKSKSSKAFVAKRMKPGFQSRLLEKRRYENAERQLKLLQQQIKAENRILETMQMQAAATTAIAEAASKQAQAMSLVAESTQSIALAVNDAIKYLKRN